MPSERTRARTAFSLFFPPVIAEFGWGRGVTAGTFSFGFVASAVVSPLIGRMMDRFGPRVVMELENEGTRAIPASQPIMRVAGTSGGVPFVIADSGELHIDVTAQPFELRPGRELVAAVRFDAAQWLTGVTFPAGPNPVTIDAGHNPQLLTQFCDNVRLSPSLASR